MLFLFTMFGAYRLTQFSDQLMTPEFLVTPDSANYSPEKAFDQIQKHPEKITDGFFNAGFTQYRWWVLTNISPTEKSWLQIANPHINDLRIYEEENGKWKQPYVSGDYYPYAKRIFDDPDYWFPIEPKQQRILMRVDKKGESLNIPLRLIRESALAPYLANRNFFHGMFLGWIVLLLMLNLFLWISLKDPIHFFYILYVSFSFLYRLYRCERPKDKIVLSPKKPTGEPYIFAKNIQLPPRLYCDKSNNKIYTPKNPNADKKKRASVFCLA